MVLYSCITAYYIEGLSYLRWKNIRKLLGAYYMEKLQEINCFQDSVKLF